MNRNVKYIIIYIYIYIYIYIFIMHYLKCITSVNHVSEKFETTEKKHLVS